MSYHNKFRSWKDVQKEYDMSETEPDEVIYADYEIDSYEGSSYVVYRRGGKYYAVYAVHCSCYGLENSWDPEEYESRQQFVDSLDRMNYRHSGEQAVYSLLKGSKGT